MWAHLAALDKFVGKHFAKVQRQKKIQHYFKPATQSTAPPPAPPPAPAEESEEDDDIPLDQLPLLAPPPARPAAPPLQRPATEAEEGSEDRAV